MPTQLWVRAPVPGPRKLCHPAWGPGVGGSLPSAGRGPRLESKEQGRAGGLWEQSPAPSFVSSRKSHRPSTHTHTHTHTHTADPLPENPALNASAVSSAPRGWVRIRMGCEAHDFPAQHLVWAKYTTADVPGPRDSAPSPGLEPAGALRPTPAPGVSQTQASRPHGGAREGRGQRGRGAPALKGDTDPTEGLRGEGQGAATSPHSHPRPAGLTGARTPLPGGRLGRDSAHTALQARGCDSRGGGCLSLLSEL